MNPDDPLAGAISDWQRKHHIADDDPVIAVLELVRLQLQHARVERGDDSNEPPSFDDFRGTIELLGPPLQSLRSSSDRPSRGTPSLRAECAPPERRARLHAHSLARCRRNARRVRGSHFVVIAAYTLVVVLWVFAAAAVMSHYRTGRDRRVVVRLGGFFWTRADFCRGWLITGDTGSGKTRSGITPLLFQVFTNEPTWGGLCIDDKGLYWETLSAMARHFGREDDLILLQVRPDDVPPSGWTPRHTYNLTSDPTIPYNTFAKAVGDTASSLGQAGDKGFFKNQAQIHVAAAQPTKKARSRAPISWERLA